MRFIFDNENYVCRNSVGTDLIAFLRKRDFRTSLPARSDIQRQYLFFGFKCPSVGINDLSSYFHLLRHTLQKIFQRHWHVVTQRWILSFVSTILIVDEAADVVRHVVINVHETVAIHVPEGEHSAGPRLVSTERKETSERIFITEEHLECFVRIAMERVREVSSILAVSSRSTRHSTFQSFLAILIVDRPFVGVAQYVVRLGDFFELFFRIFRLIFVRMELKSHLSVRLLNLIFICACRDAQNLIVVFAHFSLLETVNSCY